MALSAQADDSSKLKIVHESISGPLQGYHSGHKKEQSFSCMAVTAVWTFFYFLPMDSSSLSYSCSPSLFSHSGDCIPACILVALMALIQNVISDNYSKAILIITRLFQHLLLIQRCRQLCCSDPHL